MIIGAGVLQIPAILTAKRMGLEVAVIDMDCEAPGFVYADWHYVISTVDIKAAVAKAKEIKPDGVITLASDMPMRTVAAIAGELGLNAISETTAVYATNKIRMRERLKANDVPVPEFYAAQNYDEYFAAVKRLGSRFIVKPADSSGSRGVFLVNGICNLKEVYEYSKEYSSSGEVIAEEYMEGPEVSVEALTVNGETHIIAVTDKLTTGYPYFVEMGHSIPSLLPEKIKACIKDTACNAVKAIGIDKGASHTEIIVTDDGPKIVELGARLGGDCITTHLVPLATGVDMVECSIRIALGEEPDTLQRYTKGAAVRYFNCPEGLLASIEGVEEAMAQKGVQNIIFEKKIGDKITLIHNSNDRAGMVITQADTPMEAVEICYRAIAKIKLNTI
jgi:biotin carboxylase